MLFKFAPVAFCEVVHGAGVIAISAARLLAKRAGRRLRVNTSVRLFTTEMCIARTTEAFGVYRI